MGVLDLKFAKDFLRMADDGWSMGWHEANGGNLSYRLTEAEADRVRNFCKPKEWNPLEEEAFVPGLAGDLLMITAAGSHFRSVSEHPPACVGIIEVDESGAAYRKVWGFKKGGCPTSELPTHLMVQQCKKRAGEGCRVVYHAHPSDLIALTCLLPPDGEMLTRVLWRTVSECAIVFPKGLGALGWMVPGSIELGQESCALMESYDAVVWSHHGLLVAGRDFDSAFGVVHTIDKAAGILVKVRSMGAPEMSSITDGNLREMSERYNLGLVL